MTKAKYLVGDFSSHSFCQLRGQFAVQVYGVLPPSTLPPLRIMLATCGLGLAALVAAYIGQKLWPGEEEEVFPSIRERNISLV